MRITVCELDGNLDQLEGEWAQLVAHVQRSGSELVLLPEMPFGPWLAARQQVDLEAWKQSEAIHMEWIRRFAELGGASVVTTRPVTLDGDRYNQGVGWEPEPGIISGHRKTYLPDEPGFWEGTWYRRGPTRFDPLVMSRASIGILICTELWFLEQARNYGKAGVEILAVPRATESATVDKWIAAGRVAAVCAGAYCLSSNWRGAAGDMRMGGGGWVCDPDGVLVARTSTAMSHVTVDIDLARSRDAKHSYPRYVIDGPVP